MLNLRLSTIRNYMKMKPLRNWRGGGGGSCLKYIFEAIFNPKDPTAHIQTNQTGKLPHISRKCCIYILILLYCCRNTLLSAPVKSRQQGEILRAYKHFTNIPLSNYCSKTSNDLTVNHFFSFNIISVVLMCTLYWYHPMSII